MTNRDKQPIGWAEPDFWIYQSDSGCDDQVLDGAANPAEGFRAVYLASPDSRYREALEEGVISAMEMLREVAGVGTDIQAYDHVIRRLQDKYGGWDNQVRLGVQRATQALEGES